MKIASLIAGALLGLMFAGLSAMMLLNLAPAYPAPPEGSPQAMFMGAFGPTGYMTFVKICELLGGILVAIPKTRNFGLLVLGPIIVNILAYHGFIMKGEGLANPILIVICLLAAFLLWVERKAFLNLLH